MIKRDLNSFQDYFSEYTELRIQENRTERLVMVDGNIVTNSESTKSGVSARVYKNGSWGFASNADFSADAVKEVIGSAVDNANFMHSRLQHAAVTLPGSAGTVEKSFATEKKKATQKEKIELIKNLDQYIQDNCKQLSSRSVVVQSLDMEKNIITSDGGFVYTLIPRALCFLVMTIEKDGSPVEIYEPIGGLGQYEDVFASPENYYQQIDSLYSHLLNKADGVYSNAGYMDCILDAAVAGILAHEAIGHTTEADFVLGGSVAGEYMGKKVASPLVTLVDFANKAHGKTCPVPVFVDDEGTQSQDAIIIQDGILKSFMHNKETAHHFGVQPTGNARAYDFSDEPLVRMRNTAILPGKDKLEDMISSVEDGYYLLRTNNGQADSTSEFMFGITLGYEIKNGKLGKGIRDTTISGVAFDMLNTITMISDDMSWSCAGMCGKKQMIPVGMGGPAIKCKVNIGGK